MRTRLSVMSTLTLVTFLSADPLRADDALPPELLVTAAQPAVFRIMTYGDIDLRLPNQLIVDDAKLKKDYEAGTNKAPGASLARYFWDRVAVTPEQYLAVDSRRVALKVENKPCGSGTGFLISREGIVLTNAHVVADQIEPITPQTLDIFAQQVAAEMDVRIKQFSDFVGGPPSVEQRPAAYQAILRWYAGYSMYTTKVKDIRLVLKFDRDKSQDRWRLGRGESFADIIKEAPKPITVPLVLLAKGEPMPGKDVAVLKADLVQNLRAALLKDDPKNPDRVEADLAQDQNDRFICLPLAEPDKVLPGTRIVAMGFPGAGFNADFMDPSAEYKVSAVDGQVGQYKLLKGREVEAIEMTANVNHGDSGGPVLDPRGRVIGLNVALVKENPDSHTLAIPIDFAWEMLRKLKIKPDPGPLTAKWHEGLRLFRAGKYAEAQAVFTLIMDVQEGIRGLDGKDVPFGSIIGDRFNRPKVNPYVYDLWVQCNTRKMREQKK